MKECTTNAMRRRCKTLLPAYKCLLGSGHTLGENVDALLHEWRF